MAFDYQSDDAYSMYRNNSNDTYYTDDIAINPPYTKGKVYETIGKRQEGMYSTFVFVIT